MLTPLIRTRELAKEYRLSGDLDGKNRNDPAEQTLVRALRGVSLSIDEGEFVAVMGPSGSGKSTFMNILGCLDRPTGGHYELAGEAVEALAADTLAGIRNRRIGFVFQQFNLLPRTTALDNVELPLLYAGVGKEERAGRARRRLIEVGLGDRLGHLPNQLSGGQQQRVAIARALVGNPRLILADEPTGALDSQTSVEVMALLQTLNRQGITIVLVTHEPDVASFAGRQIHFRDGQVVGDRPNTPADAATLQGARA